MVEITIEFGLFSFDGEGYTKALRIALARAVRMAARAFLLEADSRIPVRTGFLRGAFGTLENAVGSVVGGAIVPTTNPSVKKIKLAGKIKELESHLGKIPSKAQRRKLIESKLPKGQKRTGATKELNRQESEITATKGTLKKLKASFKKVAGARDIVRHSDKSFKAGEYYYPVPVGRHGLKRGVIRGGILKDSSSGQQFATPSGSIITSTSDPAGWKFNYSVDIRYYAYNDRRLNWDSWRQAIRAFNDTYQSELQELPNILDYVHTQVGQVPGPSGTTWNSVGDLVQAAGAMEGINESDIINNG